MRALITGGTGFCGQHLVRQLVADGVRCRLLVRPTSDRASLSNLPVEWVQGDITEPATLRRIAQDVDIVYHLAAAGHVSAISASAYDRFRRINVAGTRHLLAACRSQGIKRFIHFSSTAAMGLIQQQPIHEDTPCNPTTPYQRSKWESEQVVREAHQQGLPTVTLRPCMIYGPGGAGEFQKFCRLLARGVFPRVGCGPILTPLVHVHDVVQAARLAATRGKPGRTYLVASDRSIPLAELRRLVLDQLGVWRPYLYVPRWLALIGAGALEQIAKLTGRPPLVTRRNIASTIASRVFDITRAREELGYDPAVPFERGIPETVAWYRAQGVL